MAEAKGGIQEKGIRKREKREGEYEVRVELIRIEEVEVLRQKERLVLKCLKERCVQFLILFDFILVFC